MSDDLKWSRLTYQPLGECDHCGWRSAGRTATTDGKRHARENPDHLVRVEQLTRGLYVRPSAEESK